MRKKKKITLNATALDVPPQRSLYKDPTLLELLKGGTKEEVKGALLTLGFCLQRIEKLEAISALYNDDGISEALKGEIRDILFLRNGVASWLGKALQKIGESKTKTPIANKALGLTRKTKNGVEHLKTIEFMEADLILQGKSRSEAQQLIMQYFSYMERNPDHKRHNQIVLTKDDCSLAGSEPERFQQRKKRAKKGTK